MDKEFKSFFQLANQLIESLISKGYILTDYDFFKKYNQMYTGGISNPKKYLVYIISQMKNSGLKFVNPAKKAVQNNDIVGASDDIYYTWAEVTAIAGNPELKCFRRWLDVLKILYDINNLLKYKVKQCYLINITKKEIKRKEVLIYIYGGNNSFYTNGNISGNNVSYTKYTTPSYSSMYTVADYNAQRDQLDNDWGTYAIESAGTGTTTVGSEISFITRSKLVGYYNNIISPAYAVYSESYDNIFYSHSSSSNDIYSYTDAYGNVFDTNRLPLLPTSYGSPGGYWYKTYGNESLKYKYVYVDYATWNALGTANQTEDNAIANALPINNVPEIKHYYRECSYENTRDFYTNEYGGISAPVTYLTPVYSTGSEQGTKNGNCIDYTLSPSVVYNSLLDKDGHFGRGKRTHKYLYQVEISGGSGVLSHVTEFEEI